MKLLLCTECHDIFNLRMEVKECECGKVQGAYKEDRINAWYNGPAIPLGFRNDTFEHALRHQPPEGMGERFEAFVIPVKCPTFKNETV